MNINSPNFFSKDAHLVCKETLEIFPLSDMGTSIGRSKEMDIVLVTDLSLSKRHAMISRVEGKYYLRDLRSTNGTLLNGAVVEGMMALKPNDEIFLGRTTLLFCPSQKRLSLATGYVFDQRPLSAALSFLMPWRAAIGKLVSVTKLAFQGHGSNRASLKESLHRMRRLNTNEILKGVER